MIEDIFNLLARRIGKTLAVYLCITIGISLILKEMLK